MQVKASYGKYKNIIENGVFPLLLFVYPLIKINQGLDVADTTYSLVNFQYFGQMEGTWMVATYLANVVGSLLMRLPFGGTLIGMYFYTSLVQSATALTVYFGMRKKISVQMLFLGEMMVLGLCWCPATILYNYLTYFFMTAGILLIYRGLLEKEREKEQMLFFVAAGVCLGLNVAVRMPNVVQAAFILAVWYGVVITRRESGRQGAVRNEAAVNVDVAGEKTGIPWRALVRTTAWCLLGYALGFGIPLVTICIRYGISAYPDMVQTMFAMTEQAADYKPTSMLTGMFGDYIQGLYWLVFALICAGAAGLAFLVRQKLYGRQDCSEKAGREDFPERQRIYKITGVTIKTGYIFLLLVLLRFYWGRGMFTFRYYEHDCRSMYYPTVLFLLVTVFICVYCLLAKRIETERKILAALLLIQIFVTPLGSNNKLYPIINNLFLAMPFTLWTVYRLWRDEEKKRAKVFVPEKAVWMIPFTLLTLFLLVQSAGFHLNFVFQDGIWGEPRDMKVELPEKAAGIYTNRENQALLEELALFAQENLGGKSAITYGELPGLYYLLDMPPALSTAWPDLDSYRMTEYERDLEALEERIAAGEEPPAIILSTAVAAYVSDDGEAIVWFGVDMEEMAADKKLGLLMELIRKYGYTERFGNARYVVYQV